VLALLPCGHKACCELRFTDMYKYIYLHVYLYTYIYIYVRTSIQIYTYVNIFIYSGCWRYCHVDIKHIVNYALLMKESAGLNVRSVELKSLVRYAFMISYLTAHQ
jgi:hypothetical protein